MVLKSTMFIAKGGQTQYHFKDYFKIKPAWF